jgi:hypothetical protein
MCLACDMEAMWFAVMDARAASGESAPSQPGEPATRLPSLQPHEPAPLLPPPERGRVGEGVAGDTDQTVGMCDESEDPHPNPPPEEGGGGASGEGASNESARQPSRSTPSRRFACEETSAE